MEGGDESDMALAKEVERSGSWEWGSCAVVEGALEDGLAGLVGRAVSAAGPCGGLEEVFSFGKRFESKDEEKGF